MKAKAVRIHGAKDLRLDEFELPEITDDEVLVKVVSDSICMSTYKCATLGEAHKRVHDDVAEHPAICGHEFAGDIVKVGANHADKFKPGMKFTIQPALNYKGTMWSPGYSYEFFGGDATYCILPSEVMECGCLLEYTGEAYYEASLAEPMSCSIGAFNANYHTHMGVYTHDMGIKEGGKLALLAAAGPMGLGAITYALHRDVKPSMVVVGDIDQARLDRAAALFPPEKVKEIDGIDLHFVNTGAVDDPAKALLDLTDGTGYEVGAMALIKGGPADEQENAKKFIDFMCSAEGQNLYAENNSFRVPTNSQATPAEGLVTLDSVAVIDYDAVWAAEHKDEFVAQFEANIASSENLE